MMTIWLAVIITCSNTKLDPIIKCDLNGSEEMWAYKSQCEAQAPKLYKGKITCLSVDVEMKGLPEGIEVKLK